MHTSHPSHTLPPPPPPSKDSRVQVHLIPDAQGARKEVVLIFELRENTSTSAMFLVLMFPKTDRVTGSQQLSTMTQTTAVNHDTDQKQ